MEEKLTKAKVLETLQVARTRWMALLAEVGEERMTEQMLRSWLSVKDIIAHVAWYEQETADLLQPQRKSQPASDWLWEQRQDTRNAVLFKNFRDRPLAEVLADEQRVYLELIAALQAAPEDASRGPQETATLQTTWQTWELVANHTYEHYRQHEQAIREWIAALEPGAPDPATLIGSQSSRS